MGTLKENEYTHLLREPCGGSSTPPLLSRPWLVYLGWVRLGHRPPRNRECPNVGRTSRERGGALPREQ